MKIEKISERTIKLNPLNLIWIIKKNIYIYIYYFSEINNKYLIYIKKL